MQLRTFILLGLLVAGFWYWHGPARQLPPPGVAVATEPTYQNMLTALGITTQSWPVGHSGYAASPFATVHLRARILGTKRYHDRTADFAPTDFILGWGPMSDSAVYGPLDVTPGSRSYTCKLLPGQASQNEINANSIEYHIIPADEDIAASLGEVNLDDIVVMDGFLVAVREPEDAAGQAGSGRIGNICAKCRMFRVTHVAVEPHTAP